MLSACVGGSLSDAGIPRGVEAYSALGVNNAQEQGLSDYRIGALDTLSVTVFQEPDLSVAELQVDASGRITLPLIGTVLAAGKTTTEISKEIADRFDQRFLRNPHVTVSVAGSVSQRVVVQGEVNQAGVYDIRGRTTLLEALALARGETRTAALHEVVVFRNVDGQRMAAMFDVQKIRRGEAIDPPVLGSDVVVVGSSRARAIWRDVLQAAPLLGVFRPF